MKSASDFAEDQQLLLQTFFDSGWTLHLAQTLGSALAVLRERPIPVVITERALLCGDWKDLFVSLQLLPHPASRCHLPTRGRVSLGGGVEWSFGRPGHQLHPGSSTRGNIYVAETDMWRRPTGGGGSSGLPDLRMSKGTRHRRLTVAFDRRSDSWAVDEETELRNRGCVQQYCGIPVHWDRAKKETWRNHRRPPLAVATS
jgi:hypothetical protein